MGVCAGSVMTFGGHCERGAAFGADDAGVMDVRNLWDKKARNEWEFDMCSILTEISKVRLLNCECAPLVGALLTVSQRFCNGSPTASIRRRNPIQNREKPLSLPFVTLDALKATRQTFAQGPALQLRLPPPHITPRPRTHDTDPAALARTRANAAYHKISDANHRSARPHVGLDQHRLLYHHTLTHGQSRLRLQRARDPVLYPRRLHIHLIRRCCGASARRRDLGSLEHGPQRQRERRQAPLLLASAGRPREFGRRAYGALLRSVNAATRVVRLAVHRVPTHKRTSLRPGSIHLKRLFPRRLHRCHVPRARQLVREHRSGTLCANTCPIAFRVQKRGEHRDSKPVVGCLCLGGGKGVSEAGVGDGEACGPEWGEVPVGGEEA
ncbi:hypothetical protein P280DRAFT_477727 [Massarina eburnea CBS 473.64]|uniref:Uncharacterized protein n=1 Tax=Massarina eburnea CBS 473.64 TaxID=1395130 RepID=A0A6A6S914_9PLEO|nr:hypothetical protein P280DRAFT_477727 [Massarina eburnea CBS 473.64]